MGGGGGNPATTGFRGGGVGAVLRAGRGGASTENVKDSLRGGATGVMSPQTEERREGAEEGALLPPGEGVRGVVPPWVGVGGNGPKRGSENSSVLCRILYKDFSILEKFL